MLKPPKSCTVGKNSWNVGDILLSKITRVPLVVSPEPKSILAEITDIKESEGLTTLYIKSIDNDSKYRDSLMYIDQYWTNLGPSKYWKVLYGRKEKI